MVVYVVASSPVLRLLFEFEHDIERHEDDLSIHYHSMCLEEGIVGLPSPLEKLAAWPLDCQNTLCPQGSLGLARIVLSLQEVYPN